MMNSYDYEPLMAELKSDMEEDLIKMTDQIKVVRNKNSIFGGYHPIVDYYWIDDKCEEITEVMYAADVWFEMEKWNEVIK